MILKHKTAVLMLSIGLSFGFGLNSCSSIPLLEKSSSPSPSASPAASTSPAGSASPNSSPSPAPAAQPAKPAKPASKIPLTMQKLKNTEYYLLAEGPVKLTNGKYQDKKKRTFTLGDVSAYGDLNKDGIKDAVAPLILTIDGRKFTYLVGVLNDKGNPKNASAEFLGERVKVKTLSANAGKITVKMDKYGPNDPDCCPSQTINRTYLYKPFKPTQTDKKESKSTKDSKSKKDAKPAQETKSNSEAKPSPSPEASPKS
ncbi:hypothetical protein K9N68_30785 [Kovacikia minuta CCNUW1]|uniref:hypothetical protein n=1 Tax=Kovacikia minuta TaxID=2931930 RepID=UPI001CCBAC20|nr:hypothetical protein [Kovacikia minuta]UBF25882.1 hypothetical protein K9N68_30785 [Kovacikia minuta CCNUW1]